MRVVCKSKIPCPLRVISQKTAYCTLPEYPHLRSTNRDCNRTSVQAQFVSKPS